MQRSRYNSMLCGLALVPVSLLFTPPVDAIPADPDPATAAMNAPPADPQTTAAMPDRPLHSIPCLAAVDRTNAAGNTFVDTQCGDTLTTAQRLSVQFGRRFEQATGMIGKTDGIRFDYRLSNGITVNGMAGYPALANTDTFNTDKQVFGLSADSGRLARAWNLNAYVMEQQNNVSEDQTAIGGSARYRHDNKTVLFFYDYETAQESGRAFMATGAWKLPTRTTLSATIDVRNRPVQKRHRKYLQHAMTAKSNWTWLLPTDRIAHFTRDRDRDVTTLGLGLSHEFSRQLKLSGDMAVLDISNDTSSAGGGSATTSPSEYFYHLKLTGNDWMLPGNRSNLDLRHSVTAATRTSSASFKSKYSFNRRWHLSPTLSTDYRSSVLVNSVKWVTSPALKMEYNWKKQYGFQLEAGGKWTRSDDLDMEKHDASYFVSMGYQLNF